MIGGGENGTSECHLSVFNVDVALALSSTCGSPPTPIGVLVIMTMPVKAI